MLLEESGCLTYLCFTPMTLVSWSSEYPWMGFTHPSFILKKVTDLKGLHMCKKLYCRFCRLPVEDICYVIIILCIHTWIILLHVPTWTYTLLHILLLLLSHFSRVRLFGTPWSVACQAPMSMGFSRWEFSSVQFSSVAQSCPTLYDPMNRSTPGLPVHHQLLEFTQTHVHRVSDAIRAYWQVITGKLLLASYCAMSSSRGSSWPRGWTRVSDVYCICGRVLEKETATHSSVLAWRIPWAEEPGRLQSMGVTKSWTWLSDFHFHFFTTRATCHYYIHKHTHYPYTYHYYILTHTHYLHICFTIT